MAPLCPRPSTCLPKQPTPRLRRLTKPKGTGDAEIFLSWVALSDLHENKLYVNADKVSVREDIYLLVTHIMLHRRGMEILSLALPFFAAIRKGLVGSPPSRETRRAAILSAEYISECYIAIRVENDTGPGIVRDASKIAGFSHTELVRQCLYAPGNHAATDTVEQRMHCQILELSTLTQLIKMDATPELSVVLSSERVVTASAAIIKRTRETPQHAHDVDPNRDPVAMDWVDLTVQMWRNVFERAAERDDDGPVVEAIESGVTFLLEEWSVSAFPNQICESGFLGSVWFRLKFSHRCTWLDLSQGRSYTRKNEKPSRRHAIGKTGSRRMPSHEYKA